MSEALRAGYKLTEVGVIPEDWEAELIGRCLKIRHGKSQHEVVSASGEYPIFGTGGEMGKASRPLYSKPSVLIGRKGTIDAPRYLDTPFWTVDTLFYSEVFENVDAKFMFYQFCLIDWYAYNEASGVPSLNAKTIEKIQIPYPPSKLEQRAIATALSDIDTLLAKLDTLSTKKRNIKQATMQQLLTGQTRLPGFSGEWEVKRLGEIADVKTGPFGSALHESDYVQIGTPIITVEHLGEFGVTRQNLPLVSDIDCKRLRSYALEFGDIVFSRVGSVDRNSLISKEEVGWLFSGRLLRVRPDKTRVFAPYLSFQFHTEKFKNLVLTFAVGQTMASLNTKILNSMFVTVPTVAEQTAIATVLSDMDTELATLESRRDKTHALKQGMMQELLTGRIRLV